MGAHTIDCGDEIVAKWDETCNNCQCGQDSPEVNKDG